ncbi:MULTISPECIES: DUF4387 domain-containing protein [Bordetella]|uniref:Acyl-CoA synthetase n=1 Tax=Bordetella genomosp. 6 TaxID=463024 RepID=A0ABX4F6P7_9BORD|nr:MULTISPECIES: DUF4387 domain-containing protein [Bordetella]AOB25364.1 acyl-CoA synthetase [Bordetella bronchiseptica]AWP73587.1 acyl-CoA synthetase [Bordetella bronchiseptica]AZW42616.1 DUF4387 domain-containing protein [Bordetella bronchiseptica]KCV60254.1 PF14330 domain protein [Bordetella bronchiseptica 99-R-0433]KDB96613.1 PF14330 domain protein [Bordetella bronchiseptica E010]
MKPSTPVRLVDLAKVIRSKNAGPLQTTLDLMFATAEHYRVARDSEALSAASVARLYGIEPDWVRVIPYEAAHAIKIVLDRPLPAGQPGDRDVYGAQQHYPLLDLTL